MTQHKKKYQNESWLKEQIEDKERSIKDIANEVDRSRSTIQYWAKKFDLSQHWKHSHIKDERGNEYDNFTVKELSHINKFRRAVWICEHEDGYKFKARSTRIRRGKITGEQSRPKGLSAFKHIFRNYKKNAKRRDLYFNLSQKQFKKLTQQNCFYCNKPPANTTDTKGSTFNGDFIYNGLDRVNNNKGYTIDNIVPCCPTCNRFKGSLDRDDFLKLIEKIHNNLS